MPNLQPDLERQATASIRGYGYQCYQTIKAWLHCGPNEEIRCEFAEDIDVVRRDMTGSISEAELTQVKHEQKNVTLNSQAAVEAINNFFRHKNANPTLLVKIRLWTISDRGKERGVDWKFAPCGIDLWDRLKKRTLHNTEQDQAIAILRSHLKANGEISAEAKSFLDNSDNSTLLSAFVDQVSWDTSQASYLPLQDEIRHLLANRERPITDHLESDQIIDRLFRYLVDLISTDTERKLTRDDLERLLSEETCARVDRQTLQQLTESVTATNQGQTQIRALIEQLMDEMLRSHDPGGIDTGQPVQVFADNLIVQSELLPLPLVCSARATVLHDLQVKFESASITWVHGSTGYGKTTLANLLVRALGVPFVWCRLSYAMDIELASSLQAIMRHLVKRTPSPKILVLDDVRIAESNVATIELMSILVRSAKEKGVGVLVTSQDRLPSRLASLIGTQSQELDVPGMSVEEIASLVTDAGLKDDTSLQLWSTFIYAKTLGHPQLVGAYVTYARDIAWTISGDVLIQTPPPAEQIMKESRKQLAATIPSEESRELAKRLSLVSSSFPRDFALAIGRAIPSLQEPGRAFDSLVGPWIEQIDQRNFSLSPLLQGYAESEVGEAGLNVFHRMIAYGWFLQKKLTPVQYTQFITSALASKEQLLIGQAAYYVISVEAELLADLAKELWVLPHLTLGATYDWSGIHPLTRFLFRKAQLRVAKHNNETKLYGQLDSIILSELEGIPDKRLSKGLIFVHYTDTSIAQNSPLTQRERTRRAIIAVRMFYAGIPNDIFLRPLSDENRIDHLVMLATANLTSLADLEYLFTELNNQQAEVIAGIFSGFDEYQEGLSLLLDRVWVAESKKESPQWNDCQRVFSRIADFALTHRLPWLFASSVRSRMVLLDEYQNDSEAALSLVREARETLGTTHPLIDLAESTVRFRREEYPESLDLIDRVEEGPRVNEVPLERLFTMRRAIIGASRAHSWEKVKQYAARGLDLAASQPDSPFTQVAKIAFRAELGWVEHERNDRLSSTNVFENVLNSLESFPDQSDPLFHILRLRVGHTLTWMADFIPSDQKSPSTSEPENSRPFCGMFANFDDPPAGSQARAGAPYEGFWALLAKYGSWAIPRDQLRSYTDRGLAVTPQGQWYMSVLISWEARFANDLASVDLDSAVVSGINYVASQVLSSGLRKSRGDEPIEKLYGNFQDLLRQLSSNDLSKVADALPAHVLEPVLMTLCSLISPPDIDLAKWRQLFTDLFGPIDLLESALNWIEVGRKAATGDEDSILTAKHATWNQAPIGTAGQRFAPLICSSSNNIEAAKRLSLQASFLLQILKPLNGTVYASAFTRMVARRWGQFAQHQKFMIASPNLYVPMIIEATSPQVPTLSECARLLIIVGDAIQARWPADTLERLKFFATLY